MAAPPDLSISLISISPTGRRVCHRYNLRPSRCYWCHFADRSLRRCCSCWSHGRREAVQNRLPQVQRWGRVHHEGDQEGRLRPVNQTPIVWLIGVFSVLRFFAFKVERWKKTKNKQTAASPTYWCSTHSLASQWWKFFSVNFSFPCYVYWLF